MSTGKTYIAIDLKSFYASVECAYRGLDPMTTNLVVADLTRTEKTICLAVSPSLKALGVPGRPRLYEVIQKVDKINAARLNAAKAKGFTGGFTGTSFSAPALEEDPSLELGYITAPPRMASYIEISTEIYRIYLKYISPQDIHVYSIDEVFIDATPYLETYHMTARELVTTMVREVLYTTGITATAGIGTNLYLCKIAMDIVAKHAQPDDDGVRIAELDEMSFRRLLWTHTPLTDFWQIGNGTVKRLNSLHIHTIGELARFSTHSKDRLYKAFGIDAELLIDHAWGYEPCGMKEIKAYVPETTSLSQGQVLSEPYSIENARLLLREMTDSLVMQLTERRMAASALTITVNYDRLSLKDYSGPTKIDHYGREVPKPAHGSITLPTATNLGSRLQEAAMHIYDRITDPKLLVRRLTISADRLVPDDDSLQLDMFADTTKQDKEKRLQEAVLNIKKRYGKNALLKGISYTEKATMRQRNGQIGGHKA